MLEKILNALEDHKAEDITILNVQTLTPLVDTMIICTANVSRHAKSIADAIIRVAKINNHPPIGVEGTNLNEWILVDLNDIVVHVMLSKERELYQLEKLWSI